MMEEAVQALEIRLHDQHVGYLAGYQGGRNVMVFDEGYRNDPERFTLTLTNHPSFSKASRIMAKPWIRQQRLHPYFSNLLPEGALRDWLAQTLKVHPDNEFPLLAQLGHDLPGAVTAIPLDADTIPDRVLAHRTRITPVKRTAQSTRGFSLAGIQMKFSMREREGRFHFGHSDELGDWIIKTPSTRHRGVPVNEYTAMRLAMAAGVNVPETRLVALKDVEGLPEINLPAEPWAYAIKRFDRQPQGRYHTEDMAQVFFRYPHEKYQGHNYEQIGRLLRDYTKDGLANVQQFARRLLVNILLANGDAHLKNWSLLYPDRRTPVLAPAYDIVVTQAYIPEESEFALNLNGQKRWYQIHYEDFKAWASAVDVPWPAIRMTLDDTIRRAREQWKTLLLESPMLPEHQELLRTHWRRLQPEWRIA
ncbi:HipA domain-containing protein [Halomonas sp. McH1-25]|uniref:type II toxin-antitoxin system HipA family toxin n=1 Tax=unclassified Halomonas TaxID=2609666 RepID=UPI001EF484DE|nr:MULTISPECIES: type II toxin-antitoxin system HipA family toxin [unclassified Halomonas]MCG7598295.1 HipA domain-containing protein [Halomonas sp. McH1-25]MCP1340922.1 HipA domain-containing protein [Halomonas sp. FL8]MCP1362316.1 HipA domain-containing protein [Halomonas sp. BBD45]MCP1364685.1 HipA domain-containing protein [Halomonas sp. BBD48]